MPVIPTPWRPRHEKDCCEFKDKLDYIDLISLKTRRTLILSFRFLLDPTQSYRSTQGSTFQGLENAHPGKA